MGSEGVSWRLVGVGLRSVVDGVRGDEALMCGESGRVAETAVAPAARSASLVSGECQSHWDSS